MKNNNTKYYKVMEYLRNEILSGRIQPGQKIPSENRLAEQFSISRHTVRKSISILVNEGLLYTEHGRGTYSSGMLRKNRDSRNIAVITTYISEYIFPQVISGIDEVLSENGYSIILKNTGNDTLREEACLKDILGKDIAGLIVEPTKSALYSHNIKFYKTLENYGIPYVFIHGYYEQLPDKPGVMLDDAGGMFDLVSYLVRTGHRNICGIFKADDIQGINRHKGYAKALTQYGLVYDPDKIIWFHTEDRNDKPFSSLKALLDKGAKIDAITCYNDEIAHKVVALLTENGRNVPGDISVTGFDDSYLAESSPVKLTTATHPKKDLGRTAASLVLDLISGNRPEPAVKVIKPEIVIRESTLDRSKKPGPSAAKTIGS